MGEKIVAIGPCGGAAPTQEVPQWASWSWTVPVRDPASFQMGGVPGSMPVAADLIDGSTDVWFYYDGDLMFRGRIIGSTDSLTQDGGTEVAFTAVDYRGLLKRRVLLRQKVYSAEDQADIAWSLIEETQTFAPGVIVPDSLGITLGSVPAGTPRDRTYEPGAFIGDLIDDLANVIGGFEWRITPQLELLIGTPRIGQTRAETIDFGGLINSLTRDTTTDAWAQGVWYSGGPETSPVYVQAASVPARTLFQASLSNPDVSLQTTVDDKADGALAEMSELRRAYKTTVSPGRWLPTLIEVGDTAALAVNTGRMQLVDQPVRLVEQVLSVTNDGAEQVAWTLVEDD